MKLHSDWHFPLKAFSRHALKRRKKKSKGEGGMTDSYRVLSFFPETATMIDICNETDMQDNNETWGMTKQD